MKIVEIYIEKKENLIDTYNKNMVSSTLIEYVLNKIEYVKKSEKISIHLYVTEDTKGCASIIRNGLIEEYQKNIKNHNIINIRQFILLLIGLCMLLISTFIKNMNILNEIVLIGAWVPIWEAIELELFTDTKEKRRRKQLKKILKGEIIEIENKNVLVQANHI